MKRKRWNCVADRVKPGAVGAEVGVFDGGMSKALFNLIHGLRLFMVDRWQVYGPVEVAGDPDARMPRLTRREWKRIEARARAVAGAHAGATIIKGDSVEAAATIADHSLDFVFIDGDHSYDGCRRDISAWRPKVRTGGWLMGHDYTIRPGVRRAVDELGVVVELDADKVWAVRI